MTDIFDQASYWEQIYTTGGKRESRLEANDFAQQVTSLIKPGASVLELGCGPGSDSAYFARSGFQVTGTDFSPSAIKATRERYGDILGLAFETVDIGKPFPYPDNALDAIYARLSLHYFTDVVTRSIISECQRVLTAEGLLCFMCKSTDDPLFGKGERIELDMYINKGHVRHFFSEAYVRSLLEGKFTIQTLEARQEDLYGKPSAYVLCVAAKVDNTLAASPE